MRTKSLKKNKINVITLGCSKNVYDSEVLMGQLKANGKDVEHEAPKNDEGNVIVINTCGIIDNAKAESVNTILEYADKKERGLVDKVFVTGCLSERYRPDLEKEIPNSDWAHVSLVKFHLNNKLVRLVRLYLLKIYLLYFFNII